MQQILLLADADPWISCTDVCKMLGVKRNTLSRIKREMGWKPEKRVAHLTNPTRHVSIHHYRRVDIQEFLDSYVPAPRVGGLKTYDLRFKAWQKMVAFVDGLTKVPEMEEIEANVNAPFNSQDMLSLIDTRPCREKQSEEAGEAVKLSPLTEESKRWLLQGAY